MVTRREKIKRSVCKVQEQIFSLYTKLLEQERVSGMHWALEGQNIGQGFAALTLLLRENSCSFIYAVESLSSSYLNDIFKY